MTPVRLEPAALESSTLPLSHCAPMFNLCLTVYLQEHLILLHTNNGDAYPLTLNAFNPYKPNRIPHTYQLKQSITILTLKAPRQNAPEKCRLLKSSAANNCLTLLTNLNIEANWVDPDQTAPIWFSSYVACPDGSYMGPI